jgi:hypothetical protein
MRGFDVPMINPTLGASEYGANLAQWDWKPFDTAMKAATTTFNMVQSNKEEKRKQEEFELEKLLFPSKQKAAELQLVKMQSEINENNANAERLKGMYDSKFLMGSGVSGSVIDARYGDLLKNSRLWLSGDSAQPVTQTPQGNNPFSLYSDTSFF